MTPKTAQQAQTAKIMGIEVLPSVPWEDEHGRLWETVDGHPIPTGYKPPRTAAEMAGRLETSERVVKFCLAGNATITLVSVRTGKRYTFRIRRPDDFDPNRPIWFVSVLKGSDNEADFGYIGQITTQRHIYMRGNKCWKDWYAASDAFKWAWRWFVSHSGIHPDLEVWHEGRCGRCNRKLTVPESVASGFGPECINYV